MTTSPLSNIHADFNGYEQLIKFYHLNKDKWFDEINISIWQWFEANMCTALGGILDKLSSQLNSIKFETLPPHIQTIIQKNGFLSHFGYERIRDNHNTTIQYLKLKPTDGRYFHDYVITELLTRPEIPNMSAPLTKKITESIYEIFVNAQMHSGSEYIYTCGQFYPTRKTIELTITDTGIGFKNKINSRFNKTLSSIQAIKWATNEGYSTKINMPGGIGLALLKEFIKKNNGTLQIVSDDGFYQFDANGEQVKMFSFPFPGAIVNMIFRTDDTASYSLAEEIRPEDIF